MSLSPDHVSLAVPDGSLCRYETLKDICCTNSVNKRANHIVMRVYRVCHAVAKSKTPLMDSVNVRTFLASYMVLFYSDHIFEANGEKELALVRASAGVLTSFLYIVNQLATTEPLHEDRIIFGMAKSFPEQVLIRYMPSYANL